MNNTFGTIVTPMERGQITLPKYIRDKLGITVNTPLNVTLEKDGIIIKPLVNVLREINYMTVRPKVSKKEYIKILQNMKGIHWTRKDDIALQKMRKKEKVWEI